MASSAWNPSHHRKLALIIGNDNYSRLNNRLSHSTNNARDLSDLLKTISFNVAIHTDDNTEMMVTITNFAKTINDGDLILFYFAGHGYQVNGENYLIPVDDAQIETDRDVEDFAVNVDRILKRLVVKNPSYVTVLILDCYKPYLLKNASASNSTVEGKGLREIEAPAGTFIQFAYGTNQTVSDVLRTDRNDLFTKHLLRSITRENVDITDIFRGISDDVYKESNKKQRPLSMNGLDRHRQVYLNQVIAPPKEKKTPILLTKDFLSEQPLSSDERNYYEDCKEYYHMTEQPLIAVSDEVFDNNTELTSTSLKFGIDEDCNEFNLQDFLNKICSKLNLKMKDIAVKQIQTGSSVLEADIFNKFESDDKKLSLKMIYNKLTDKFREELAKMKIFFMFMGPIKSLSKMQKFRAEIKLNPQYNRIYARGHDHWEGAINDGKDRGNKPYYCPVGWKRCSFYVSDNFYEKFKGWCICYHGTKFSYGLSILLSGLKPAEKAEHGAGIYATPSVNYACHPRYSEVKPIQTSYQNKFFKSGKYVQFVLECRVHPSNITKIAKETLAASHTTIDCNISNAVIEWVIDNQNKKIVDFNDPQSSIICTGLLIRVTDEHPGLLPESQWWYEAHICRDKDCCLLGIDLDTLTRQCYSGNRCKIIYD